MTPAATQPPTTHNVRSPNMPFFKHATAGITNASSVQPSAMAVAKPSSTGPIMAERVEPSAPPLTQAPTIWKVGAHNLDHYDPCMGLGRNTVLLADEDKGILVKYSIDRNHKKEIFEKVLPHGMMANCRKHVLADGRIVLTDFWGRDTTHIYANNLQDVTLYNGDYGMLIGTLSFDLLAYAKKVSLSHGWEVHVYSTDNHHQRAMELRPSGGRAWSQWLSVCRNPDTGQVAVVDRSGKTLDIYSQEGKAYAWFLTHLLPTFI